MDAAEPAVDGKGAVADERSNAEIPEYENGVVRVGSGSLARIAVGRGETCAKVLASQQRATTAAPIEILMAVRIGCRDPLRAAAKNQNAMPPRTMNVSSSSTGGGAWLT